MQALTSIAVVAAPSIVAAAASEPDPIFAAIEAHRKAFSEYEKAIDAFCGVETELQAAGDLYPQVLSRGNPYSSLPRHFSRSHAEIDSYSPADLYPEDNAREHAELAASIERHDQRLGPVEEVMDQTSDLETQARIELVSTIPSTMKGVLSLLSYQNEELSRRELADTENLRDLCSSIRRALEALQPSA